MKIFWENLTRYPKFLVTSMTGLIIIVFGNILKPIKKNKKSQLIIVLFLFLLLFFIVMRSILDL